MKIDNLYYKKGFTIIEVMITLAVLAILVPSIGLVFIGCFKAFNACQSRTQIRTPLSQAMELMTRHVRNAQSISSCTSTGLTFYGNIGSGAASNSYAYASNKLTAPGGGVKASGITAPGTALFSCSSNLLTIDITATNTGESVRMTTNITPRNPVVYGLVGYWKLDDDSGTSAVDSSGNGYTGTLTSSAMWTTSSFIDYAATFNGSSQNVSTATGLANLNPTTAVSVSAWVYPASVAGNHGIAGTWDDQSGNFRTYLLWQSATHFAFSVSHDGTAVSTITGSSTAVVSTWYHVVGTFDGTNSNLYVDGVTDAAPVNSAGAVATNSKAFFIGDAPYGAAHTYFSGTLDDVRVYNSALATTDISQLYKGYMSE